MLLRHFCCHGWEKRLKPTGEYGMTSHPVPPHPVSCHFRRYNVIISGVTSLPVVS